MTQDGPRSRNSGSQNDISEPVVQMTQDRPAVTSSDPQNSVQRDLLDAINDDGDDDMLVQTKFSKKKNDVTDLAEDFEDFVDLEAEPGIGFLRNKAKPDVRHFHPIELKENFFRIPHERKDKLNPPIDFPKPSQRTGLNKNLDCDFS